MDWEQLDADIDAATKALNRAVWQLEENPILGVPRHSVVYELETMRDRLWELRAAFKDVKQAS